ncbi:NUDIX hydrolase [Teredinibacter sp. KSP-S5-2]|uniref:NUDIX hydrolase n=1 Tax=Teredinibacter sp. KSP-S5-2 TaxID=3034506 RepID=UPI00293458D9|nr:NUDIX domain-containing protein [Teredinibacter sp. KSP-S5-2]WNO10878.1 NUDIX domain-containing protein [Teredinibacter sp. KSP-S5-2]
MNKEENYQSEKEFLEHYDIHRFDIPLTTVDMGIFSLREDELCVLLIKRANFPAKGKWALPGGFIDLKKDNNLDETAHRKLNEKTGVNTPYLEQIGTFGSKKRDPRGWSVTVAYLALISSEDIGLSLSKTTEDIAWVPVEEAIEKYKLAFDHNEILRTCHERLKSKVLYTSLPVNLLPEEFTLTDLQNTFEIILGTEIEKKSFRKRMLDSGCIEETGNMRRGSNRPAKLYRTSPNGEQFFFTRIIEGPRN